MYWNVGSLRATALYWRVEITYAR